MQRQQMIQKKTHLDTTGSNPLTRDERLCRSRDVVVVVIAVKMLLLLEEADCGPCCSSLLESQRTISMVHGSAKVRSTVTMLWRTAMFTNTAPPFLAPLRLLFNCPDTPTHRVQRQQMEDKSYRSCQQLYFIITSITH